MRQLLPLILICVSILCVLPNTGRADTANLLLEAHPMIGYPKRPVQTLGVQRRASEIYDIYEYISTSDCPQTKAFAVSLMSRNGALARGVRAGKGLGL